MRYLLILTFLILSSEAFALTAEWNRNPEADMKEYCMYLCEGVTCTPTKTSGMKVATILHPAVGVVPSWKMPEGKVGAIAVTAVDQSGNESPLSNVVRFDTATPGMPTGLILKLSVDLLQVR